ncbi:MAG: hypothetical protein LBR79_00680 [Oscillospiraceae bacterium]|nr:hypothetical protein [Oscillospiraceae bacterium]
MFKKICTVLAASCLTLTTCFASPLEDVGEIKEQFAIDSVRFKFDRNFVNRVDKNLVDKYNEENGQDKNNVLELPRALLVAEYLKLHEKKIMVCATQSVYYSQLFTEKGIPNYVVHIQQCDPVTRRRSEPHDVLTYFFDGSWKVVDSTRAQKFCTEKLDKLRNITQGGYSWRKLLGLPDVKEKIEESFSRNLIDILAQAHDHWFAASYYDGDDQRDLGELSPDINSCLERYRYMKVVSAVGSRTECISRS